VYTKQESHFITVDTNRTIRSSTFGKGAAAMPIPISCKKSMSTLPDASEEDFIHEV
jgi:hypothetical protein